MYADTMPLSFAADGTRYDGLTAAQLAAMGVAPAIVLDGFRAGLAARVDERAESLRLSLITPGVGQALEYQEAQAQAAAALKAPGSATREKYPMLAATIGIDVDPTTGAPASDVVGVARSVDKARALWLDAGAAIRGLRIATKRAIRAAATLEAAAAAFDAAAWPAVPSP